MPGDWQPGSQPIPGYVLQRKLGEGGFGAVWLAQVPGKLQKALKIVPSRLVAGQEDSSASQELGGLDRIRDIRHPFILSTDRFEIVDDELVVVMELADRSLDDRFRECIAAGSLGIPRLELIAYLFEAAEALDLMNGEYDIQHLDIKPQNLFLVRNHIKVADFGLAKPVAGHSARVATGMTPCYAAPETFDGWASRSSDQYSLAITYQELLTGTRPFAGPTARQYMLQHLTDSPRLEPLPDPDRELVGKALSKRPDQRFASCLEFVERLAQAGEAGTPRFRFVGAGSSGFTVPFASSDDDGKTQPWTNNPSEGAGPAVNVKETRPISAQGPAVAECMIPLSADVRKLVAEEKEIGRLPGPVVELSVGLLEEECVSSSYAVPLLARFPKMEEKLVRLANQSNNGQPVTSLHDAVVRLGVDQTIAWLLCAAVVQTRHWFCPDVPIPERQWCHRRFTWQSCVAYALAKAEGFPSPHTAMAVAFLQDLGILSLERIFDKRYQLYLLRWRDQPTNDLARGELEAFRATHAAASAAIAQHWGLDSRLVRLLCDHHEIPLVTATSAGATSGQLATILFTAERISDLIEGSFVRRFPALQAWLEQIGRRVSWRSLLEDAVQKSNQWQELFRVPVPQRDSLKELIRGLNQYAGSPPPAV